MRLVSAEWVLPVASAPIRDGAVLVDGDRIVAVGARSTLDAATAADVEREHFAGCTITPGPRQRAHPPHADGAVRRRAVRHRSPSGSPASSRR